jgi:hypothetical protein
MAVKDLQGQSIAVSKAVLVVAGFEGSRVGGRVMGGRVMRSPRRRDRLPPKVVSGEGAGGGRSAKAGRSCRELVGIAAQQARRVNSVV